MEQKKETSDKWIGWTIIGFSVLFIGMCIPPAINDTREFFRIMAMVLGGGVGCTLTIMWVLQTYLPEQGESTDNYEEWIKENTDHEELDK